MWVSVSLYINCNLKENSTQNSFCLSFLPTTSGVKIVPPHWNCIALKEFVCVKWLKQCLALFANYFMVDKNKLTTLGHFLEIKEWLQWKWWPGMLKTKVVHLRQVLFLFEGEIVKSWKQNSVICSKTSWLGHFEMTFWQQWHFDVIILSWSQEAAASKCESCFITK